MRIKLYLNTSVTTSFGLLVKTRLICCNVSCLIQCIVSQKMYVFCIRKLNEFLTVNSSMGKIQVHIFEKLWELFALQFESFAILMWFRIDVLFC